MVRAAQVCSGNSISGLLTDSGGTIQTWHPAPRWLHPPGRPCLLKMLQLQNSAITWGPVVQAREPEGASHTQMITALKKKKFLSSLSLFLPLQFLLHFRWNSSSSIQVNLDLRAELMWNFLQLEAGDMDGVQRRRLMGIGQCSGWTHGVGWGDTDWHRGHRWSGVTWDHLLFVSPFLYPRHLGFFF